MKRKRPFKEEEEEEYRNKRTKLNTQIEKSAFGEEIVRIEIIGSDSDEENFIPTSIESIDESFTEVEEPSSDYT
jgi:hypothetical protein